VAAVAASFVVTLRRIELVASVSNFALFIAFSVINAALIRLRFTEPDTPRPFRVPGRIGRVPLIPALGIIGAVIMMARTALLPALLAGGLVVSGILVHVWIRHGARKRA
jgi:APA family basic amino acid/polyamine antiporter